MTTERAPRIKYLFDMPADQHTAVKVLSELEGVTMRSFMIDAIQDRLDASTSCGLCHKPIMGMGEPLRWKGLPVHLRCALDHEGEVPA